MKKETFKCTSDTCSKRHTSKPRAQKCCSTVTKKQKFNRYKDSGKWEI